jgi:hypothetical protein
MKGEESSTVVRFKLLNREGLNAKDAKNRGETQRMLCEPLRISLRSLRLSVFARSLSQISPTIFPACTHSSNSDGVT